MNDIRKACVRAVFDEFDDHATSAGRCRRGTGWGYANRPLGYIVGYIDLDVAGSWTHHRHDQQGAVTHEYQTGGQAGSAGATTVGTPRTTQCSAHDERLIHPFRRGRIRQLIDGIQEITLAEFTAEQGKEVVRTLTA